MWLNLNDYQFKTNRYSYRSTYTNPMITTNQKPTTDTQKQERKEHKHTTKENHQTTREETKEAEKNYTNNQKTNNKMAVITYLSVITLNVNGLKDSIKRHRVADWIKITRPFKILLTRDSVQS